MATRGGQTPKPLLIQNALQNLLIVLHVLFGCDNCCSSFEHLFANVSTGFSSFGVQKYVIDFEYQMNVEYVGIFIWKRGAKLSDSLVCLNKYKDLHPPFLCIDSIPTGLNVLQKCRTENGG